MKTVYILVVGPSGSGKSTGVCEPIQRALPNVVLVNSGIVVDEMTPKGLPTDSESIRRYFLEMLGQRGGDYWPHKWVDFITHQSLPCPEIPIRIGLMDGVRIPQAFDYLDALDVHYYTFGITAHREDCIRRILDRQKERDNGLPLASIEALFDAEMGDGSDSPLTITKCLEQANVVVNTSTQGFDSLAREVKRFINKIKRDLDEEGYSL